MSASTQERARRRKSRGSRVEPAVADCVRLSAQALGRGDAVELATLLKAVADPTRLQMLSMIQAAPAGEVCVCDLTEQLDLTQPTISHHLRVLTEAGILDREPRATWVYYRIVPSRWQQIQLLFT